MQILAKNIPVNERGIVENLEERCDPKGDDRARIGSHAPPFGEYVRHLRAVFRAKRGWIQIKKKLVKAHHVRSGAIPLARASLTICVSRRASARATANPNGVSR